ncbi:glycosyltransferase, partial [Opitutales bacterium]|nr:glycosyltransferase [Opitutales bacterium]
MQLSIITVTFNCDLLINNTIESIKKLPTGSFEWIVIDGNSQDKTVEILKKNQNFINVFVIEPDKGIYDAMNKGILHAKGQYLLFLNAGDSFHENYTL